MRPVEFVEVQSGWAVMLLHSSLSCSSRVMEPPPAACGSEAALDHFSSHTSEIYAG